MSHPDENEQHQTVPQPDQGNTRSSRRQRTLAATYSDQTMMSQHGMHHMNRDMDWQNNYMVHGPQQYPYARRQHPYEYHHPHMQHAPMMEQPYYPAMSSRLPSDRPLVKLSVALIDTYKHINHVYYEERDARRAARANHPGPQKGVNNHGWDDENYDYIITSGEVIHGYQIKERIGKGSFGQVVRALDASNQEVAIKIIKSKKPFLMQAKTEIELLEVLSKGSDTHNIVNLREHFLYKSHQCLVFEMLSLNLYELLKNTQFCGVSLNLIRKFAKQILKALQYLASPSIDIIHCDLKPENILLRHPKRSGIKVIDFGSSCRSNKRCYQYIQSRFYRSPEVMLGLPYSTSIDMWSLGCILVEMHTGEPLFSGSDQCDQMQKIIQILGFLPTKMIDKSNDQHRLLFFEQTNNSWCLRKNTLISQNPRQTLSQVILGDPKRRNQDSGSQYDIFCDLILKMLVYDPSKRIKPEEALRHAFIAEGEAPNRPRRGV